MMNSFNFDDLDVAGALAAYYDEQAELPPKSDREPYIAPQVPTPNPAIFANIGGDQDELDALEKYYRPLFDMALRAVA